MKSFTTYALSFAVIVAGANVTALPTGDSVDKSVTTAIANGSKEKKACFWAGTVPFCAGQCPSGFTELTRSKCGDGASCATDDKAFCCL